MYRNAKIHHFKGKYHKQQWLPRQSSLDNSVRNSCLPASPELATFGQGCQL
jgi:hypothetical protein